MSHYLEGSVNFGEIDSVDRCCRYCIEGKVRKVNK